MCHGSQDTANIQYFPGFPTELYHFPAEKTMNHTHLSSKDHCEKKQAKKVQ